MISELHKDVLKLLGFEVVINAVGTVWLEDKNGFMYKNGERWSSPSAAACRTEADAWAHAPTLDALMLPLMGVVGRLGAILTETVSDIPMIQLSLMTPMPLDGRIVWDYGDCQGLGATYQEAIAALFIAACERGLIDPATDVMP